MRRRTDKTKSVCPLHLGWISIEGTGLQRLKALHRKLTLEVGNLGYTIRGKLRNEFHDVGSVFNLGLITNKQICILFGKFDPCLRVFPAHVHRAAFSSWIE